MTGASAIYRGEVVHQRLRPKPHRLRYRVFSLLLDLDELPALDQRYRLFGYNRWAALAFYDRDHGPTDGRPLRPWVEQCLKQAGLQVTGGPIRLLCYPRMFGYVFNPLSIFFCYFPDGRLQATLYEVCNTFAERHTYVIPATDSNHTILRQQCDKALYVSPFIDMDALYSFRIRPPQEKVSIVIRQEDRDGLLLAASFHGRHRAISKQALAACLLQFPFQSIKIITAIHWQALLMWLKGFKVYPHQPAAHPVEVSIVTSEKKESREASYG